MTQYACHGVVWWCLLRSFPPYPLLGDGSLRKQKYPRLTSDAPSLKGGICARTELAWFESKLHSFYKTALFETNRKQSCLSGLPRPKE